MSVFKSVVYIRRVSQFRPRFSSAKLRQVLIV